MSDAKVLGYWSRFGASGKTLHVARWTETPSGQLVVESSCQAQVKSPTAPEVPQRLILQPTPAAALRIIDGNQARYLCKRCRDRFVKAP